MSGKVVAVANMKGGVGKTTATIMLAEGLSLRENPRTGLPNRVLLVDTDPQASLSFGLMGPDRLATAMVDGRNVMAMMMRSCMMDRPAVLDEFAVGDVSHVIGTRGRDHPTTDIDLVPCTPDLVDAERRILTDLTDRGLTYAGVGARVLRFMADELLAQAREAYDWVVIDCAPGLNLLTHAGICAADATMVVTVPDPLSVFGLNTFLGSIWSVPFPGFRVPRSPLVLASRVVGSRTVHKDYLARLANPGSRVIPYTLMGTVIPETASLNRGQFFQNVLVSLVARYTNKVSPLVTALAQEITQHVEHLPRD